MDKHDVFALSSIHATSSICRGEHPVMKLVTITEYNSYMNGVNKCDQYLSTYSPDRKTLKLWKKPCFIIMDICVLNSMIMYVTVDPEYKQKKNSHKCFRLDLVKDMVQNQLDTRVPHTKKVLPTNQW